MQGMHWTPLTSDQLTSFHRDGFLIVRNALDQATIDALITAGDRLFASDRVANRQSYNDRYDSFRNAIALDDAMLPVLTCPTTVPLIVQLMGPHLQLHTSHLIWKKADPAGTPTTHRDPGWHRDVATLTRDLDHDRMPRVEIKVGYFLTDCSHEHDGQTRFVPGSHRERDPVPLVPGTPDPAGAVAPLLRAGDAVLFENRTWHAGGANLNGRTRKTLMFGYSHRWMRPDDYDQQNDALLDRCDPVQRCLLDARGLNYRADGSFTPCGDATALAALAAAHGCTAAACH